MTEPTPEPTGAREDLLRHYAIALTAADYWLDFCKDHAGEADPGERMRLQGKIIELENTIGFLCEHHGLELAPIEYEEGLDA